jgi:hypothetical protein
VSEVPAFWAFAATHAVCLLGRADALWLGPMDDDGVFEVRCEHCRVRRMVTVSIVPDSTDIVLEEQFAGLAVAGNPSVFPDGRRSTTFYTWRLRVNAAWQCGCARTLEILRTPVGTAH